VSKRKGRKYEREAIDALREHGFAVRDVTPNAGEYQRHQCDLLIRDAGATDEADWLRAEVKYVGDGAGCKHLHEEHILGAALCQPDVIQWTDGYLSGGLNALSAWVAGLDRETDWQAEREAMTKRVDQAMNAHDYSDEIDVPRDVVLFRHSGAQCLTSAWIAVWR